MRYELMHPHQIRGAIQESWPVILPLGVLEYHAEHLAVGTDTLLVIKAAEILEQEMDLVILPPFYYGASSHAVAPPEGNGSIHVNPDSLVPFAKDLFRALLRIGFRNIHFFIHHQTENFTVGMPTDLAFKFAARQSIFEFIESERGEGWWGDNSMANYYAEQAAGDDPFNWIKGHALLNEEALRQYPFDHAAEGETSLMMSLCPEGVELDRLTVEKWYTETARNSSLELGDKGKAMILNHMRAVLQK